MRARDLMTTPVITVQPWTSAKETAELPAAHGFTALPVVDGDLCQALRRGMTGIGAATLYEAAQKDGERAIAEARILAASVDQDLVIITELPTIRRCRC